MNFSFKTLKEKVAFYKALEVANEFYGRVTSAPSSKIEKSIKTAIEEVQDSVGITDPDDRLRDYIQIVRRIK